MSDTLQQTSGERTSGDEPPSGSSTGTTAPAERARSQTPFLGRLRAWLGLRGSGSIREDLADALAEDHVESGFSAEERAMLANILRLREARVDDIMVPRADVDAVDLDTSVADVFAAFRSCGHSRLPVFSETLDDPRGLVHVKDLMGYLGEAAGIAPDPQAIAGNNGVKMPPAGPVDLSRPLSSTDLVRSILFVPPSMTVSVLLANMQACRMQMALVIDEYGGTDGLVSLEDAIETVVGDIEDEHDDEADVMVEADGEGGYLVDARASLEEVSEAIGADLSAAGDDDVDTVGGLAFGLARRVPVRGELIKVPGGFEIEVLDADPRRIKRVRLSRARAGRRAESRRRGRAAPA